MARAAMRLKCNREVAPISGAFANFIQASLTSAVGLRVALGSPRRTLEASRLNSSYVMLNRWSSTRLSAEGPPMSREPNPCANREFFAAMTVFCSLLRNAKCRVSVKPSNVSWRAIRDFVAKCY